MNRYLLALILALLTASPAVAADFMFRAMIDGQTIEGQPLAWTGTQMRLLARDGRLHDFHPKKVAGAKKTAPRFRGYSDAEMRAALYEEFDGRFDFTSTGHYLVVHPKGERTAWADRFEQIYRAFLSYVRVRGFRAAEPDFPLVAVVFRNQGEYRRFVQKSGTKMLPGTLGHYDHASNRVVLYDTTGGNADGDWSTNAATIIHEATHQVAFNIGVHQRLNDCSYWIPEGLALLFESRGVWNPKGYDRSSDRINANRLRDFRHFSQAEKPPFSLAAFVASDQPFRRNGAAAYAQAWALAFYLAETRPREYCRYLETTASRAAFSNYAPAERVSDFREAFGDDLGVLSANWMRWIAALED